MMMMMMKIFEQKTRACEKKKKCNRVCEINKNDIQFSFTYVYIHIFLLLLKFCCLMPVGKYFELQKSRTTEKYGNLNEKKN